MHTTSTFMRIARPLVVAQAAVTGIVTCVALFAGLMSHHDDVTARRAGHPNMFEGLGAGIALFVAVVCGVVATLLIVGVVGLFRERVWGRLLVAAGEVPILVVAFLLTPASFGRDGHQFLWAITAVPATIALVAVILPGQRSAAAALQGQGGRRS